MNRNRISEEVPCTALRLYLWSNHPSRSWWSSLSLEALERTTEIKLAVQSEDFIVCTGVLCQELLKVSNHMESTKHI